MEGQAHKERLGDEWTFLESPEDDFEAEKPKPFQ
jgi:hypothetical protein